MNQEPVTFFLPSLRGGGAERSNLLLAQAAFAQGHKTTILTAMPGLDYALPHGVELACLNIGRNSEIIIKLRSYLGRKQPRRIISGITKANLSLQISLLTLPSYRPHLILQEHSSLDMPRSLADRLLLKAALALYPKADALVAVNSALARQLQLKTGHPRVIHAPPAVDLQAIAQSAAQAADHPWLNNRADNIALLVAAGRLHPIKDYPTLLKAFALARRQRPLRLMILGTGPEEEALKTLSHDLGISSDVSWVGFVGNPFAFMARADLLVMSSLSEGCPLSVSEALALGCNVVSTACGQGVADLLDGGRLGSLTPVGDAKKLAQAVLYRLDNPLPPDTLKNSVLKQDMFYVWQCYEQLFEQ